ncbi:MAG: FixH family protein [Actinomycetota bacterium]|nr:FixH family protein [Actinomycetota bacterium]
MAAGVAVAALALPATAAAHDRGGRAEPVASLVVRESGPLQALIDLRVRDEDGGEPVRAADVKGFGVMTRPHTMYTYFGPLREVSPGRYRARVTLPMAARWSLSITIGGRSVVTRTVKASLVIDRTALTEPATAATAPAAPILVGSVGYVVTSREVEDMVVLWVHGIAATGWILGLLLLLASATAGSGSLAPEARRRLARWYRRWGFPLVWLAAATVVATGIYNLLRVTPFDLVWRPGDFGELSQVPSGRLYEGILLVKLLLFALMLASGCRTRAACASGIYGVVFVASAPLIVAAAVALRYVHTLSHVAESSG